MELEVDLRPRIVSRTLKRLENGLLDVVAAGGHRDGVPKTNQLGLKPRSNPERLGVSRLNGHENVLNRYHRTLGNCLDSNWQPTSMHLDDTLPTGARERLTMGFKELSGVVNICHRHDRANQIFLEVGLETHPNGLAVHTTSAHEIAVHRCS